MNANLQRSAITPIQVLGKTGDILYVDNYIGTPGVQVSVRYGIVNSQNWERIAGGEEVFSGADYDAWGDTDEYLITALCTKLGLTYLGPYVPPAPPAPAAPSPALQAPTP